MARRCKFCGKEMQDCYIVETSIVGSCSYNGMKRYSELQSEIENLRRKIEENIKEQRRLVSIGEYGKFSKEFYSFGEGIYKEDTMPDADRCVCCGDIVPEGRQVCPACEGTDAKKREIKLRIRGIDIYRTESDEDRSSLCARWDL